MEQLFFDLIKKYNSTINVYPITKPGSFWKTYNNMDKVTKLKITINSPNLFEARDKAEEIAQDFKDETNAQKTEIEFENKDSGLKIKEYKDKDKGIGKFLTYIQNGGGNWAMYGRKKGKDKKIHSGENKTTITLPQRVESDNSIFKKIEEAVIIRGKKDEEKT